jgi:hypothetical protein
MRCGAWLEKHPLKRCTIVLIALVSISRWFMGSKHMDTTFSLGGAVEQGETLALWKRVAATAVKHIDQHSSNEQELEALRRLVRDVEPLDTTTLLFYGSAGL